MLPPTEALGAPKAWILWRLRKKAPQDRRCGPAGPVIIFIAHGNVRIVRDYLSPDPSPPLPGIKLRIALITPDSTFSRMVAPLAIGFRVMVT